MPCTVLNLLIAAGGSLGIAALAATRDLSYAGVYGLLLFGVAAGIIYLRGYLIPGTPTLTKRYLPSWVLAVFGKEDQRKQDRIMSSGLSPEELLLDTGVVVNGEVGDFVLDSGFASAWQASILRHQDEQAVRERIGQLSGAPPDRIEFERSSRLCTAWVEDEHLASWPSWAACIADAAAASELPDWDEQWTSRSLPVKAEILGVLRLFLDVCPTCDGEVMLSQDVVESCCQSHDVVAATCKDCDTRLFEMDIDPALLAEL